MAERATHSITDIWGPRTPYHGEGHGRPGSTSATTEEPDRWVQSCCVLCSNGCGLDIGVKDGRIVGVRGRAVDRVNRGRLGPKGLHGWVANHSPDRLTPPAGPRAAASSGEATWDEAMGLIVADVRSEIDATQYTGGGDRLLQHRPALPRGVLHARP